MMLQLFHFLGLLIPSRRQVGSGCCEVMRPWLALGLPWLCGLKLLSHRLWTPFKTGCLMLWQFISHTRGKKTTNLDYGFFSSKVLKSFGWISEFFILIKMTELFRFRWFFFLSLDSVMQIKLFLFKSVWTQTELCLPKGLTSCII